ncbi:MarR family winged helix-turn-helix transcriptional regulator [Microbispora corallina]|uniref:MarR family transcriptional regulator n=1 Tax=Microbispora corallina TaxID=83302 RepID=A0ABQ4FVN1_9ACTN|nr:MarR family transcriptional regulator [Microbispora corallina]GIH38865.1 MarR family transcriptional regulator [Microbispora corallina]
MADETERPLRPLNADEEALVRSLARVIFVLPRNLDADLVREQRITLSEYLTLMHLSEAPGRHMRMSELAAACELSLSGMTRVVTRLEASGLVERVRCGEDARGWNAVLTDAGLDRLKGAWPTHLDGMRRYLLDHLEGMDLARLAQALQQVGGGGCRH